MAKSIDLPSMELQRSTSHLSGGNAAYIEDLYEAYLKDPNEVPPEWRDYFDRLPRVETNTASLRDLPHSVLRLSLIHI